MANKKLFPNAQALPPKAPKFKGGKWKKPAAAPAATEPTTDASTTALAESTAAEPVSTDVTPADGAEPIVTEPVVEPMPSAESTKKASSKAKAKPVKKETKPKTAKPAKKPKEGMSMVEAALKVLGEKGEAMSCRDMITAMAEKGYWKSPGGLTPHNTLYSAILRLIQRDGKSAAFKKEDRGLFSLNPSAKT